MQQNNDITIAVGSGLVNVRVGAIIIKNGKILMVGNDRFDYYYSVGGRIKMGESSEEAVIREVFEETGANLEIDHLAYIHENFFISDHEKYKGMPTYEISFFYVMKTPESFEPRCDSFTEDNSKEKLEWISADTDKVIYPSFFRDELIRPSEGIRHIVTNEINGTESENTPN